MILPFRLFVIGLSVTRPTVPDRNETENHCLSAVQPFSFILSLYSSFLKNFIRKFYDVKILQQIVSPDKCGISPETDARIPLFQKTSVTR